MSFCHNQAQLQVSTLYHVPTKLCWSRASATPSDISCYTPAARGPPTPEAVSNVQPVIQSPIFFPASPAYLESFGSPGTIFAQYFEASPVRYETVSSPWATTTCLQSIASGRVSPALQDPSMGTSVYSILTPILTSQQVENPFPDQRSTPFSISLQVEDPFSDYGSTPSPTSHSVPTESASYLVTLGKLPWFQFQESIESQGAFWLNLRNHLGHANLR